MKIHRAIIFSLSVLLMGTALPMQPAAQGETTSWDGLQLVKSDRFMRVYLQPGADFRPYTKVMLDPTEVAFRKNWVRDYNQSTGTISRQISQDDANRILGQASTGFGTIFADAYQKGGYPVVRSAGPDVLRVRTAVVNLAIDAPDVISPGRTYSVSRDAGEATLVVEARDSSTGALLGRALDRRLAGDTRPYLRDSVTNKADFKILFRKWAEASVEGLNRLKGESPLAIAQK